MQAIIQNNKYLLIAGVGIVLLFIILLITVELNLSTKNNPPTNIAIPTPTPTFIQNQNKKQSQTSPIPNINVVSSQPANNSSDIPLNTVITINFNQPLNTNYLDIEVSPNVKTTSTANSNTLTIVPSGLATSTIYTFTIRYANNVPAYIYAFRTIGAPSDTFDFPHQRADLYDIKYHPDTFLSRRMPHSTDDYDASTFLSNETGYFEFNVQIKITDKVKAQQEFLNWVRSQGLTDDQISTLAIHYQ